MRITCPHCSFAKEIAADKIPANVVRVNCPDCKQPFPLTREETLESGPTLEASSTAAIKSSAPMDDSAPVQDQVNDKSGIETGSEETPEPIHSEPAETTSIEPTDTACIESAHCDLAKPACGEQVEPASIGARYAALLIDSLLILFMVLILRSGLALLGNGIQTEGQILLGLIFMLFALSLSFAYHALFIGACGQTPGKRLLRIRVIQTDRSEMTYRRAMLREVFGKTLSTPMLLGYLMALFHPERLAAHDKIADTCVVKYSS